MRDAAQSGVFAMFGARAQCGAGAGARGGPL
jgi:hypothetical protein